VKERTDQHDKSEIRSTKSETNSNGRMTKTVSMHAGRKSTVPTQSASIEVARLSREAAAARSCGRKPAVSETDKVSSREAATAIGRAERAAAASRLKISICLSSVGLHPRLHAAIASRFLKSATFLRASVVNMPFSIEP
jgi:hypothetical protein